MQFPGVAVSSSVMLHHGKSQGLSHLHMQLRHSQLRRRAVVGHRLPKRRRKSLAASSVVDEAKLPSQKVTLLASEAMLLCAFSRVSFSAMAPFIGREQLLGTMDLSYMHSAMLAGYFLGHIPAGVLADRAGGAPLLMLGCAVWSAATALHVFVPFAPSPVALLVALRFLVGLGASVAVPALASMLAQLLPKGRRPRAMSTAYGCFNIGSVLGLSLTPLVSAYVTWPIAFSLIGAMGVSWSIWSLRQLGPSAAPPAAALEATSDSNSSSDATVSASNESPSISAPPPSDTAAVPSLMPPAARRAEGERVYGKHHSWVQICALAWAHSVIGWGFFILQNWIPTYLGSLGLQSPVLIGFLAALPWASSSLLSFAFGALFERLEKGGMSPYRARTTAHAMACLGAAAPMLVLWGLGARASALASLACMGVSLSMQTCNYPGFHSYVQEYGSGKAGTILGITNSCGIITGIVGNLATGAIVVATGSYEIVFLVTGALYASSFAVWLLFLRGDPVYPHAVAPA